LIDQLQRVRPGLPPDPDHLADVVVDPGELQRRIRAVHYPTDIVDAHWRAVDHAAQFVGLQKLAVGAELVGLLRAL